MSRGVTGVFQQYRTRPPSTALQSPLSGVIPPSHQVSNSVTPLPDSNLLLFCSSSLLPLRLTSHQPPPPPPPIPSPIHAHNLLRLVKRGEDQVSACQRLLCRCPFFSGAQPVNGLNPNQVVARQGCRIEGICLDASHPTILGRRLGLRRILVCLKDRLWMGCHAILSVARRASPTPMSSPTSTH